MALAESHERIDERLSHGGSLAEVEKEIIDSTPFDEEHKAALWLYAAATVPTHVAEAIAEGAQRPRSHLGVMRTALRSAASTAVLRTRGQRPAMKRTRA